MKYEERKILPTLMDLYDLYHKIFSLPKGKDITNTSNSVQKKRKFETLNQYKKISKRVGFDLDSNVNISWETIEPFNFERLFLQTNLHDKITQLLCICRDYTQVSFSHEIYLMHIYGKISCFLDYLELELNKLRQFYIFMPDKNSPHVIDEIIEKFYVPQIGAFINSLMQEVFPLFSDIENNDDYLLIKHIDETLVLIIKNDFNLTAAYKNNLKKFIQDELKIKPVDCNFYKIFGNNDDEHYPSIDLVNNWINDWLIGQCQITDNPIIFDKIKSKHILLSIFRKIKQQMENSENKYLFKHLVMDLTYYISSDQVVNNSLESLPINITSDPSQLSLSHILNLNRQNYYYSRKTLLYKNIKYFNDFFKDEFIQENVFTYYPEHEIYQTLNFLNNKELPSNLLEYLRFGIDSLTSYSCIDEKVTLLKENNSSRGINIIYLFTEAIKDLVNDKLELAKTKITEAYSQIDNYPIGTMFYRDIFAFYIGICQIDKKKPHQFTSQINYIADYNRRSFMSAIMHFEYNIISESQKQKATHVENSIIIKTMVRFNQFCRNFKLKAELWFNPFREIEEFHGIITQVMYSKFTCIKTNFSSCNDILKYINSNEKDNVFNLIKELNRNPKVSFTRDNIQDFYESRTFYIPIIEDLGLTKTLKFTQQILFLPLV